MAGDLQRHWERKHALLRDIYTELTGESHMSEAAPPPQRAPGPPAVASGSDPSSDPEPIQAAGSDPKPGARPQRLHRAIRRGRPLRATRRGRACSSR